MNNLTKEDWIAEVTRLLCASQGAENDQEQANCREWAEATYDESLDAAGRHEDMDSPLEAHNLELSYGD